jgi:hypothetical protein
MTRRKLELRFLLISAFIATVMAVFGLRLVFGTWSLSVVGLAVILLSNLIWVPAAFWISRGRRALLTALLAGAISPFVAAVVLFPPWSFALIVEKLWSVLAIGVATGAAIYAFSRSAWRAGPRAA